MKTIIAGSRDIVDYDELVHCLEQLDFNITEVVSGTARGVDRLGERWAEENNIPVKRFPANWNKYGKRAGFLRNEEMAEYAEAVVILWDGKSKGTKHMYNTAVKKKMPVALFQTNITTGGF